MDRNDWADFERNNSSARTQSLVMNIQPAIFRWLEHVYKRVNERGFSSGYFGRRR
jgi:hypothetical protein